MSDPASVPKGGMTVAVAAIIGAVGGLITGGLGTGVLSYNLVKNEARKGWNLVPVVVAVTDIPAGTVVKLHMISQRQVPEQFVTSSMVRPEHASHVLNQKVLVPLQAGDSLLWSQVETLGKNALVAAADIPVGATLAETDVMEQVVPQELLTESYVLIRDRPQVVGRSVSTPFRRGDPILWTHFRAPDSASR